MSPSPLAYDDLLVDLAETVLVGCVAWAALIVLATAVEAASAGRVPALSWVATPPALRRALLATLGLALAGGLPGPVSAAVVAGAIGGSHRPAPLPASLPAPLPVPTRPLGGPGHHDHRVVVGPGDTLWAIAAAHLPHGADDAAVADAVRRWHARNRGVIGPDPDLIRPGQRLASPTTEESR